jgi:hypothetical protein
LLAWQRGSWGHLLSWKRGTVDAKGDVDCRAGAARVQQRAIGDAM